MLESCKRIYFLLGLAGYRRGAVLLGLFLINGFMEMAGVASILPFMAVVSNPSAIEDNGYLNSVFKWTGLADPSGFLVLLGFAVFVLMVTSLGSALFTNWVLNRFVQRCNTEISTELLRGYFNRPYAWFLGRHSSDLGRTVLSEAQQVVNTAILPAMSMLSRVTIAVLLLGLIIYANPIIALTGTLVLGGAYALVYIFLRLYLRRLGTDNFKANERRYRIAHEALTGIKEVKFFGIEQKYLQRYFGAAREYARGQATYSIISLSPRYVLEGLAFGALILFVIVLLLIRKQDAATIFPVIALYAFAGYRLLPALQGIYNNIAALKYGAHTVERVYAEISGSRIQVDPETDVAASSDGCSSTSSSDAEELSIQESIDLVDVTFSYPGSSTRALDGLSLKVPVSSMVGIVGSSGAGKTTLIDIMLGLLTPDEGELLVGGKSITSQNIRRWQHRVGYVPQQIFLIDDTIAANIAFGQAASEIDHAKVERAARIANLHDFVVAETPNGYETQVGERGVRLSGGQRQRIGIARALYHDPDVLIFDEATSALDNLTERAVMEAVQSLGKSKTIVMIAHRLTTVRDCDLIYFLEGGRNTSQGTYEELKRTSVGFRNMVAAGGE